MDVLNYTPLDQSRLEAFYNPPRKSRRMDVIFVLIGLITAAVIILVIYVLYKRAQTQKILPKKIAPSVTPMPTETSIPTETPTPTLIPLPPVENSSSESGVPVTTEGPTTAPQGEPEVIPQDEIPN